MSNPKAFDWSDGLFLAGAAVIAAGLAMVYVPAGVIFCGMVAVAASIAWSRA